MPRSSTSKTKVLFAGIFGLGLFGPYARLGGISNLNLSPTFMSCRPSVQPGMTPLSGKLIGSPRSTELSKTVPLTKVPW